MLILSVTETITACLSTMTRPICHTSTPGYPCYPCMGLTPSAGDTATVTRVSPPPPSSVPYSPIPTNPPAVLLQHLHPPHNNDNRPNLPHLRSSNLHHHLDPRLHPGRRVQRLRALHFRVSHSSPDDTNSRHHRHSHGAHLAARMPRLSRCRTYRIPRRIRASAGSSCRDVSWRWSSGTCTDCYSWRIKPDGPARESGTA